MARRGGVVLVVVVVVLSVALVAAFGALGGVDRLRAPAAVPTDVCADAPLPAAVGDASEAEASRILLLSLHGAACALAVSREDLVLALARGDSVATAAQTLGVTPQALEDAVLGSIRTSVEAEQQAGRVTPAMALAIRTLVDVLPAERLLGAVRGSDDACGDLPWKPVEGLALMAAEVGVKTGLRAACALRVVPLEAVAALTDPAGLEGLAARSGRSSAEVEQAVRVALGASLAEATAAGALTGTEGSMLAAAARVAPVDRMLAIVRGDEDPCAPFPWPATSSRGEALAAIALIGVVDAACQLGTPTFDTFAALADQQELDALLVASGRSQSEVEQALKGGIDKGLAAAQEAGAISVIEVLLLRTVLSQVGIFDLLRNFVV